MCAKSGDICAAYTTTLFIHQNTLRSWGYPYTKGSDFLETYYLFSAIYGGISLGKAIKESKNKIKVLIEFETLLSIKGVIGDINSYMILHYPGENTDSLNTIKIEMNQLQIDINNYQFLKNIN